MSATGVPELETMRIEIEGEIGTLTLDRPKAFNAMDPQLIGELAVAFAWLADRAPIRALIVTGSGPAFCSGGDLNWFKRGLEDLELDLPSDVRRGAEVLHQAIVDLRRIAYPVIAAVNGPAAGAGFSLALACDLRLAAESAFFAPGYGRIGASPDGGMTYFLPRIVGPGRALELLLEDPDLGAADAKAEGIVSDVVPAAELMALARAKAEQLTKLPPHYVRMVKLLVGGSIEHTLTEHLQLERHGIADSMGTENARIGVTAFFAGEKPQFVAK
ncbi:MAG: enoyl-CoA hydratase/isomerase family protein [Actinobacteria bacterium]|nr:enoyl-CoA hydratase/isomerase family protein [Actinomycetota bacterium]